MLTTLLAPSAGQATVAGADLLREWVEVRRRIGYVAQSGGAGLDCPVGEGWSCRAGCMGSRSPSPAGAVRSCSPGWTWPAPRSASSTCCQEVSAGAWTSPLAWSTGRA
jgi:hypothetical protein